MVRLLFMVAAIGVAAALCGAEPQIVISANNFKSKTVTVSEEDGFKAMEFNGKDSVIEVPTKFKSLQYTVSIWFLPQKGSNFDSMTLFFRKGYDQVVAYANTVHGPCASEFDKDGKGYWLVADQENEQYDQWYNVTLVGDSKNKTLKLYFDGALCKEKTTVETLREHNGSILLGATSTAKGLTDMFLGKIALLEVYGEAMSADEVKQLYDKNKNVYLK